jgi:hypothetical protein
MMNYSTAQLRFILKTSIISNEGANDLILMLQVAKYFNGPQIGFFFSITLGQDN